MLKKSGSVFYADMSATSIILNGRQCLLGIFRDITEKKKMEEELIKAQKLESVGVFAGGIAHDFNNLLQAIIGNISLAKMYINPDDKAYERLEKTEKASMLAKNLTQQLLTFSKGGEPIKTVSSISEILEEATRFSLRGSKVKCQFKMADDLLAAEVDRGQLSQVAQRRRDRPGELVVVEKELAKIRQVAETRGN